MGDLGTDLLCWAEKLPLWQRDLLRRLAQGELLSLADYQKYAEEAERVEFTKSAPWANAPNLPEPPEYIPIDASHLQITAPEIPPVCIQRITHLEGANDLTPGATLQFSNTALTLIAGRNGSGKSGYIRILKQVAASRGPEKVLPNAFKQKVVPKAVISYRVGGATEEKLSWQADVLQETSPLQRVRIFDAKSAAAHLAAPAEIAYVPPTLQILSDYTAALRAIAEIIDVNLQKANLSKRSWPVLETGIGLDVFKHLGSKSGLESLDKLTTISDQEFDELKGIPVRIQQLTVSDPAKMAVQARSCAAQLSALARNLNTIIEGLNTTQIDKLSKAHQRFLEAEHSVTEARKHIQLDVVLAETGSEKWRKMWLAAKEFFEDMSDHEFPDFTPDAVCALCQQPLEASARQRFEGFAEFMKGEAQTELQVAINSRQAIIDALNELPLESAVTQEVLNLVTNYNKDAGEAILPLIARATSLRDSLAKLEFEKKKSENIEELYIKFHEMISVITRAAKEENASADKFSSTDSNAFEATKLQEHGQELKLRQQLAAIKSEIKQQHDLAIRADRIQAAIKTCDTTAASKENTKLSKDYVSKVCLAFANEVKALGLDRVPVELAFDKSSKGVSYIRVSLIGAPNVPVATVLSEGEQRIAAIAGFFADLTESGDGSTLVFDDPVSSLDHSYREAVARRLIIESQNRQVIVFSHDFTFVQYLYEQHALFKNSAMAENPDIKIASFGYVHIERCPNGAGAPTTAEQWRHVSITERISRLNERIQNVGKLYRAHDDVAYEKEARDIVGAIRETWEYFVEQDLLYGIVQRHERAVQTQRLKKIVDINDADVAKVNEGMSITSRWLTGHTAPVSDATQVINPDQLSEELKKLIDFRKEVINRRNGK